MTKLAWCLSSQKAIWEFCKTIFCLVLKSMSEHPLLFRAQSMLEYPLVCRKCLIKVVYQVWSLIHQREIEITIYIIQLSFLCLMFRICSCLMSVRLSTIGLTFSSYNMQSLSYFSYFPSNGLSYGIWRVHNVITIYWSHGKLIFFMLFYF